MKNKFKKILITGGGGFLGTHIVEKLLKKGFDRQNIIIPRSKEFDLRRREDCDKIVKGVDLVIHTAARVGGIGYNRVHPAVAFYDNAMMAINMIDSAYRAGVKKFVGIGSVCSYPKVSPVPFKEENLWDGYPEETNAPYGLAKKMMLVQSQAYSKEYNFNAVHLLMINLFGPGDNYDPEDSHVISGLIQKIALAKKNKAPSITAWGTGKATREFLYVANAADAVILAAEKYDKSDPVNIGSGREISIKELTETIARLMEYNGEVKWDTSKPDGQLRRGLDTSKAYKEFGFKAFTDLGSGLLETIRDYQRRFN